VSEPLALLRDGLEVACWLFKANPEVWPVEEHLGEHGRVDGWSVAPGYRGELLRPGHPAVLWLTGRRAGVIAVGAVTGLVHEERQDDGRVRRGVDVALRAVPPIRKGELLEDPRFARAEPLRSARLGSPNGLTEAELAAIEDLLPDGVWPELA
jgi:hypothetical protein